MELLFSHRASLLGKVSTKLIRKPELLKPGLQDPGRKLTTDLCPIIKSSSDLGALSSFLPSQSPKCFLPMLLLFLSPISCKILFQNVSQPSANGISSCLTITKPPGPWPKGPNSPPPPPPPITSSVPSWPPSFRDIRRHSEQIYNWRNSFVIFSRDQEKKMLWTRKLLVGCWPGPWNLNIEQLI